MEFHPTHWSAAAERIETSDISKSSSCSPQHLRGTPAASCGRMRTPVACNACRRQKVKCEAPMDLASPCRRCESGSILCVFEQSLYKEETTLETRLHELERRQANADSHHRVTVLEARLAQLESELVLLHHQLQLSVARQKVTLPSLATVTTTSPPWFDVRHLPSPGSSPPLTSRTISNPQYINLDSYKFQVDTEIQSLAKPGAQRRGFEDLLNSSPLGTSRCLASPRAEWLAWDCNDREMSEKI